MRYHIARDVLGVCLTIATAMAQGPASSSAAFGSATAFGSAARAFGSAANGELFRVDRFRGEPDGIRRSGDEPRSSFESGLPLSLQRELESRSPQGEEDTYTLGTLFRQHHGEFMDRREAYDPDLELRARAYPSQRIDGEPGHFDLIGYDFDLEVPMLVSTDGYLLFGLYQYGRHYVTSASFGTAGNASGITDETLTAAGLRLGFGVFMSDNVLLEVETNPGVYSDLDGGMHHNDLDFPSSLMVTTQTMEGFFFKIGARYNQVYRDAPWLPWLGFSWQIADSFRIDVLLPEKLELSFLPSASTSISLGAMVQGAQYHVRAPGTFGQQRSNAQVQEIIAYLGLTHRFSESFSLACRGGMIVAGDYRLTSGASNFDYAEGTLDPGVYADITFGIDW